jgi:hypothetical protein
MADNESPNKSEAIRNYLTKHPNAMPVAVVAALSKKHIEVTPGLVSNIKNKMKAKAEGESAVVEVVELTAVPVETPAKNGATVTLEQIKKVAQTVKTLGGLMQVTEVLETIKEVGGPKKFRELAEAMAVTAPDVVVF